MDPSGVTHALVLLLTGVGLARCIALQLVVDQVVNEQRVSNALHALTVLLQREMCAFFVDSHCNWSSTTSRTTVGVRRDV